MHLFLLNSGGRRKDKVRIGCASGFWGDTPTSVPQLLDAENTNLDYIMFDYLSELTMSLLTAAKQKNPQLGYAPDFVQAIGPYLADIKSKNIKLIANAGGINTPACVAALKEACKKAGVDLKIAQVEGDNMIERKEDLFKDERVKEMSTGKSLPKTVHSMTAYFGAGPIVKALEMGADIVVTGRTADSALALAPCVYELGWELNNPSHLNLLSAGSLAGHLIECGGQATGGLFTDWPEVDGYENLGFPVVEVAAEDGTIEVTKPDYTGGLLNRDTISEQLLYEIGDPRAYTLPDVVCDWTNVTIENCEAENGDEAVKVSNAKGLPPTPFYKICSTYMDGFRGTSVNIIGGGNAAGKGRKVANAILARSEKLFAQKQLGGFDRKYTEMIGSEDSFGNFARATGVREAVVWMAVQHRKKEAIDLWAREIASAGTGMAPGICNMVGGRPRATPCLRLFSFLYPKSELKATVSLDEITETYIPENVGEEKVNTNAAEVPLPDNLLTGKEKYPLAEIALSRSGDKGDSCNIGIIARHPAFLPYIKRALTPAALANYFEHFLEPENSETKIEDLVEVYDLPGINAINILMKNSLGGGGMASLRPDPLGKSYGQRLLSYQLESMPPIFQILKAYDDSKKPPPKW